MRILYTRQLNHHYTLLFFSVFYGLKKIKKFNLIGFIFKILYYNLIILEINRLFIFNI